MSRYPVFPLIASMRPPGEDSAGGVAMLSRDAKRCVEGIAFEEATVVLLVTARLGDRRWGTAFACERSVFAAMLEAQGGVGGVLGASVRLHASAEGHSLAFTPPREALTHTSRLREDWRTDSPSSDRDC